MSGRPANRGHLALQAAALIAALIGARGGAAGANAPSSGAPMTAANRSSGIAPLAVFFDAVDTREEGPTWRFPWSSGVRQPSDMEGAEWSWDFGDVGAGTWRTTGLSKNTATGYTAAHVYETPGTYTVTLKVRDTTGAVSSYAQTITVRAFSGTTGHASASGVAPAPGTERAPTSLSAGWAWVNGGANRRLLLKRGDTFSTDELSTTAKAHVAGNIVGAYGADDGNNRPRLALSPGARIRVSSVDWRFMDLELVGSGRVDIALFNLDESVQTANTLVLRVRASGAQTGFGNEIFGARRPDPHDGVAWVDCEQDGGGGVPPGIGMYVGGRRLAVMGCSSHDTGSHNLRVWLGAKAVVSHNRLWGGTGDYQHALKIHSHEAERPGSPTSRWITVSDNLAMYPGPWAVSIGPENAQNDERVGHVIVERNHVWSDASTRRGRVGLQVSARHVMIRNNVLDGTGGSRYYAGAIVMRRGVEPAPLDVRFLNNTVVRRDPVNEFHGLDLDAPGSADVTVRNNIAWAPFATTRSMVDGTAANLIVSDNLAVTIDPRFTDASNEDFTLSAGSKAVDAGAALPEVRTDYRGVARSRGAAYDVGAFESR